MVGQSSFKRCGAWAFDWQDRSTTRTSSLSTVLSMDASNQQAPVGGLAVIPRDLASVESFQNALLVHQKRLKANSAQSFMTATSVDRLIANYHAMISNHLKIGGRQPGPNSADLRKSARTAIANAIDKYDGLIEERRKTLEEHGVLLEIASDVMYLKSSERLLAALELQIVAAQDLSERMAAREAKTGWKVFKQSTCA